MYTIALTPRNLQAEFFQKFESWEDDIDNDGKPDGISAPSLESIGELGGALLAGATSVMTGGASMIAYSALVAAKNTSKNVGKLISGEMDLGSFALQTVKEVGAVALNVVSAGVGKAVSGGLAVAKGFSAIASVAGSVASTAVTKVASFGMDNFRFDGSRLDWGMSKDSFRNQMEGMGTGILASGLTHDVKNPMINGLATDMINSVPGAFRGEGVNINVSTSWFSKGPSRNIMSMNLGNKKSGNHFNFDTGKTDTMFSQDLADGIGFTKAIRDAMLSPKERKAKQQKEAAAKQLAKNAKPEATKESGLGFYNPFENIGESVGQLFNNVGGAVFGAVDGLIGGVVNGIGALANLGNLDNFNPVKIDTAKFLDNGFKAAFFSFELLICLLKFTHLSKPVKFFSYFSRFFSFR